MSKKTAAITLVNDNHNAAHNRVRKQHKERKNRVTFTASRKASFLSELAKSCNVQHSADITGVSVDTVYRHRKMDEDFRAQWAEAIEIAYDELMLEMLRRARYGTEKPIIYGGKKVGVFNDLNDTMAMRLLSMHMANVANHKTGKKDDMTNSDETYQILMQRISDIKRRLNSAPEVKSLSPDTMPTENIKAENIKFDKAHLFPE